MELDPKQTEAVNLCLDTEKRIVAVTGEAGTGKTSILRNVGEKLMAAGYSVAICAPTGKAAKRIYEATGLRARTVHKLLEFPHPGERDPKTGKKLNTHLPKRDKFNPLEEDFVLCDEYAMVNQDLHRQLLDALPRGGRVRMFGDINQLPPIESTAALKALPTPFTDMLERFPSVRLTTIHRQGEGSGIVANGHRILQGWSPVKRDDFNTVITEQPINVLRDLVMSAMDNGVDYSTTDNQIITPMNKRWIGTYALNAMLQDIFRPEMDGWLQLARHEWDKANPNDPNPVPCRVHVGDKVVCTQNNYDIGSDNPDVSGLFNGETGIVREITQFGEILIDLGDRIVNVPPEIIIERPDRNIVVNPQKDIALAYALTCHKCQGSEYQHVIYIMNKSAGGMLYRKQLYTGITRARKAVTLITDMRGLSMSLASSKPRF